MASSAGSDPAAARRCADANEQGIARLSMAWFGCRVQLSKEQCCTKTRASKKRPSKSGSASQKVGQE